MKNKGMVLVAILATLLLPLATPGKSGISSSHDVPATGKSACETGPSPDDQEIPAADLSGLTAGPRMLILLSLLLVTGAATTDVVNGEIRRCRIHRLHASRQVTAIGERPPFRSGLK